MPDRPAERTNETRLRQRLINRSHVHKQMAAGHRFEISRPQKFASFEAASKTSRRSQRLDRLSIRVPAPVRRLGAVGRFPSRGFAAGGIRREENEFRLFHEETG